MRDLFPMQENMFLSSLTSWKSLKQSCFEKSTNYSDYLFSGLGSGGQFVSNTGLSMFPEAAQNCPLILIIGKQTGHTKNTFEFMP